MNLDQEESVYDNSMGTESHEGEHEEHEEHEEDHVVEYTPEMLDMFKQDVRRWLDIDNAIKVLQDNLKDRRKEKTALTSRIMDFMKRHNIDDLNTPMGRLRFQVRKVKAPLSQQEIQRRINDYYKDDAMSSQQVRAAVFGQRALCNRASIRRLPWKQ